MSDETKNACWSNYCKTDGGKFKWLNGKMWRNDYLVSLDKTLWIRTPTQFKGFTKKYGFRSHTYYLSGGASDVGIRWTEVAKEYDGILITPYYKSKAKDKDLGWYMSWDVASACFWNADGLTKVNEFKVKEN